MSELNWMQEYAAGEAVELARDGRLTRREMLARLVAICGTVGAATAFLAACGDDSASPPAPSTTAASDATTPPGPHRRRRAGPATSCRLRRPIPTCGPAT